MGAGSGSTMENWTTCNTITILYKNCERVGLPFLSVNQLVKMFITEAPKDQLKMAHLHTRHCTNTVVDSHFSKVLLSFQ